jgi:hypothetical protein
MMLEYARNGAMLGRSTQWWRGAWDKCPMVARCFEFALNGWQRDAWILRPMAAQCLDFVPDGWWCDALMLRPMAGGATLQFCA